MGICHEQQKAIYIHVSNSYPTLQNCNGDVPSEMSTPCLLPNYKLIYIDTLQPQNTVATIYLAMFGSGVKTNVPYKVLYFILPKVDPFLAQKFYFRPAFLLVFFPKQDERCRTSFYKINNFLCNPT